MSDRRAPSGGSAATEKALQEFLSESQEIIETLNRLLLKLDEDRVSGKQDPDAVNGAFRAVHSLKGLSGLFGTARMTALSHHVEDLLDGLRLGRVELTPPVIDLLFEAVEQFQRLTADAGQGVSAGGPEGGPVEELIARIQEVRAPRAHRMGAAGDPRWGGYALDAGLLSVLTEYEEHRLHENLKAGRELDRIHASFDLSSIDEGLEDLKTRLKPLGEVITYLPSAESGDPQKIDLDLIFGSDAALADIQRALEGMVVQVKAIPRVRATRVTPPAAPAVPRATRDAASAQVRAPRATPAAPATTPPPPRPVAEPALVEPAAHEGEAVGDDRLTSIKSASQTVRVDIRKLDHLMNLVGELSLARAGIQTVLDRLKADRERTDLARELHREARVLGRKLDEMQAAILEVRMVPLGQVFERLSRVVRKISRDAGKEIRFVIAGAETELDKLIVEELSDPLLHMIRNCIDHGVEAIEPRIAAGKPEAGTIAVAAAQQGNHVVISVEDDGAGLDEAKLVRRAVERGYLDEKQSAELSRREIHNLIFLPGVSTKDVTTEMSGRGVGMDVVKTNIARLSGIIDVESQAGLGTRFTVTLPITLAIIQALVIRAAGRSYAVPLNSVLETRVIDDSEVRTIERREVIFVRASSAASNLSEASEITLPIVRVDEAFRLRRLEPRPARVFVVVVGLAQHRLGLVVDELLGQQDVVIKSLGKALDGVPGIAGATELGGQQTVLVLDVAALVEEAIAAGATVPGPMVAA